MRAKTHGRMQPRLPGYLLQPGAQHVVSERRGATRRDSTVRFKPSVIPGRLMLSVRNSNYPVVQPYRATVRGPPCWRCMPNRATLGFRAVPSSVQLGSTGLELPTVHKRFRARGGNLGEATSRNAVASAFRVSVQIVVTRRHARPCEGQGNTRDPAKG